MLQDQLVILNARATEFWSRIQKTRTCWLWRAFSNENGYGSFTTSFDGKIVRAYAHRISYYYHTGNWPNQCVLHKCDNRLCVNPAHLTSGSRQDNQKDMGRKGRACHGESRWSSKLTDCGVGKIIKRLARGEKQSSIARDYEVSASIISRINSGQAWPHLTRRE